MRLETDNNRNLVVVMELCAAIERCELLVVQPDGYIGLSGAGYLRHADGACIGWYGLTGNDRWPNLSAALRWARESAR